MIIEGLLNLLYKFLSFVLGIIPFPATPEDIQANLDSFLEILDYAQTFLPLVFRLICCHIFLLLFLFGL